MPLNIEKLRKVVEWAEGEHAKAQQGLPSEWNQRDWFCGTTCCLAGYTCLSDGYRVLLDEENDPSAFVTKDPDQKYDYMCEGLVHASGVAQEILGLRDYEASRLFSGVNDIHDVRVIAEDIAQAHGFDL